jgi:YegS/Rv2252/BmrU family lipid kinase
MDNEFCNYKVFVAVGGDGTVNSLINYLINHNDKALAIIPIGSGNGFANELGFKYDIDNLIKQIAIGKTIDIDVLKINKNCFINLAGIGLDAEIAHNFQKSGERGFISYIFSTIRTYFLFKPFKANITGNDININGTFQMISIANTRQFGNNAFISPTSKPYDRQFEIVMLKNIPLYLIPQFIFRLFKGTLKNSNYINYLSSQSPVSIKTTSHKFHIDGDPLTSDGNYEISIIEKCLRIIKMDSCVH